MFRKRFLFFWLFAAFSSGIALACLDIYQGAAGSVSVSAAFALFGIIFVRERKLFFGSLLVAFVLGAVLLFAERFIYLKSAPVLNEPFSCRISGTIISDPRSFEVTEGKLTCRYITVFDIDADDVSSVSGLGGERIRVKLSSWRMPGLSAGNRIRFDALVEDVAFCLSSWLRGQPWLMASTRAGAELEILEQGKELDVLGLRNKGLNFIERAVCIDSEDFIRENSVLTAAVAGRRAEIDPMLLNSFRRTGTMHLVAISGLHFGLAVFFIWLLSGIFPGFRKLERTRIMLCIALALTYAFFIGTAYPSVFRACIFVSLCFLARLCGRETAMLNILGMAGLIILAYRPLELFSLGFELSFFIVFCLVVLNPFRAIESRWPQIQKRRFLRAAVNAFCVSFVAWLASQVIILPALGQISFAGIFINPVAVCIFSLIMILAFMSVFLALVCPPVGMAVKWLNVWCVRGLLSIIDFVAAGSWSFAVIDSARLRMFLLCLFMLMLAAVGAFVWNQNQNVKATLTDRGTL